MFYLSQGSGKWCFLPLHVLIVIVYCLCRNKGRSGMVGQFNSYSPSLCLLLHCLHCRSCWWSLCNGQVSTGSNLTIPDEWERHIGIQNSAYIDYSKPHLLSWVVTGFRKGEEGMDNISSFVRMSLVFKGWETSWIIELVPCFCAVIKHVCLQILQYILSPSLRISRNCVETSLSKLDKCRNKYHQTTFPPQVPLASSGNTSSCGFGDGTGMVYTLFEDV